jgi:hypothetical protein
LLLVVGMLNHHLHHHPEKKKMIKRNLSYIILFDFLLLTMLDFIQSKT